jgi:hypothetical protein
VAVGQTGSNNGDLVLDMKKFYSGWFLKIDDKGKIIQSKNNYHKQFKNILIKIIVNRKIILHILIY